MQAIPHGGRVLDLCCGEGFYDRIYFSTRAEKIDGLDRDHVAIREAMTYNANESIKFYIKDVARDPFPDSAYDVVLCFSALQQMDTSELDALLPKIRAVLNGRGIFFSSVSLIPQNQLLRREEDVSELLEKYFPSVRMNSSVWRRGRVECYFTCRSEAVEVSGALDGGAKT